jgi:signal transduction histidine kinase
MRRRLVAVFVAVTAMVVVAFVVPLAVFVRDVARERAVADADADVAALFPVLATTEDPTTIGVAISRTPAGARGRLTVYLADGRRVGAPVDPDPPVADAQRAARATTADVPGGVAVVRPVVRTDGTIAVVRAFVPTGELRDGVLASWIVLGAVGVALVVVSVALADRLAGSLRRPVEALATAAHRLGEGDLAVRVVPSGPPELAEVGGAFNALAGRVEELVHAEREDVADLAHRLRTPLAALRLQVEQVTDPAVRRTLGESADDLGRALDAVILEARRRSRDDVVAVCDLGDVARARAAFWAALAEEQDRPTTVDIAAGRLPVRLRTDELEAALDVLLENVFSHTDDATPYAVRVHVHDRVATCVVSDSGAGFRHHPVRGESAASTGLGLDIARRAAAAAGGTFALGSSPEGGAEVRLVLPLVDRT